MKKLIKKTQSIEPLRNLKTLILVILNGCFLGMFYP